MKPLGVCGRCGHNALEHAGPNSSCWYGELGSGQGLPCLCRAFVARGAIDEEINRLECGFCGHGVLRHDANDELSCKVPMVVDARRLLIERTSPEASDELLHEAGAWPIVCPCAGFVDPRKALQVERTSFVFARPTPIDPAAAVFYEAMKALPVVCRVAASE